MEHSMSRRIYQFLVDDHLRLSELLEKATQGAGEIDAAPYAALRGGLLRLIGMEEKILLPFVQKKRGGEPLSIAAKLRLDQGALASLLVPPPTLGIIATLREVLEKHNPIEEGAGGLYEICQSLAGSEEESLLDRLRSAPEVRVAPHADGPLVMEAMRSALERAGHEFSRELKLETEKRE
jgi:hypothetical protein